MTPVWAGDKNQTVVVFGEQGIGDEIMFASCLPDLIKISKLVILDAHPRLVEIFRESFNIPVYGTRKCHMEQIHWGKFYKIDAKIAIGSLPKFFRKNESDFPKMPYLKADEALIKKYQQILNDLGDKPKIGLSWVGGTPETGLDNRSMDLKEFLPLFEMDADFISLQYTKDAKDQVDEFEKQTGHKIHHWQKTINDYDETAGLVSNLDLIISIPQSVVHLAGALGVPTFQITPKKIIWQGGVYGKNMPWYGSVINFWQKEAGVWPIQEIKQELWNLFQTTIKN